MASPHTSRRRLIAMMVGLGLTAGALSSQFSALAQASDSNDTTLYYYSVGLTAGQTPDDLARLGMELASVRTSDGPQVMGTEADANKLRGLGFRVTRDGNVFADGVELRVNTEQGTFYGGYRTPSAHERHNQEVAQRYSNLVKLHEIGRSYTGRHPIQALCISNIQQGECQLNQNSRKPKFTVIAQIHSRELTTGEMAWRMIDHLTQNYGRDQEVTKILDSREFWIVPMVNPDGTDKVAEGGNKPLMQRKNLNYSAGGEECGMTGSRHGGVDLNRNSSFHWDRNQGKPCSATYPGRSPGSEPETKALQQGLLAKIYPDLKGRDNEKVRPGATGGFVSMHSYSDLVLYPYGWTNNRAPDHAALKEYSDGMARILGYKSEHGEGSLGYLAPGATDDWAYGELGVPGFTYEIGRRGSANRCGGFFPAYRCQDSNFWPKIKKALMWGANQAGDPYGTASQAPPAPKPTQPQPPRPTGNPGWPQPTQPPQPTNNPWPPRPTQPPAPQPTNNPWPPRPTQPPAPQPTQPPRPTQPRPTWPGFPGWPSN